MRKVKEGETTYDLFGFLTTEPNAEVKAIGAKSGKPTNFEAQAGPVRLVRRKPGTTLRAQIDGRGGESNRHRRKPR